MEITKEKVQAAEPIVKLQGRIAAISVSQKKGIPKKNISKAFLIQDYGIDGDVHAGKWHRQVSLLSLESIEKMKLAGLPKLRAGIFAENITTENIDLSFLKEGSRLLIGNNAILEITQIGKECHTKCAIYYKAGDCIMPREGIFARVIKGGSINSGDRILVLDENDQL